MNISVKLLHGIKCRNGVNTNGHKLPFELKIKLPPPRKKPKIVERDEEGRIIRSAFPAAT